MKDTSFERLFNRNLDEFTFVYKKQNTDFERPTIVDPLYHLISMFSYRELLISQRIDEVTDRQLLKYRQNLDEVFSGKRLEDEADDEFRLRMRDETNSVSPAGHEFHYRNAAFKASPEDIVDVHLTSGGGRNINIYILSNSKDGIPSSEVLDKTRAYFKDKRVASFGDIITILPAQRIPLHVNAVVELIPRTNLSYLNKLKSEFLVHFQDNRKIGQGIALSKIISKLQTENVEGVKLVSPTSKQIIKEYQYIDVASLKLRSA